MDPAILELGASREPRQRLHFHFTAAPKHRIPSGPPQIQTQQTLAYRKIQMQELEYRQSYLTLQVDISQSDVAIEIDMLGYGSIVRGGDQESL